MTNDKKTTRIEMREKLARGDYNVIARMAKVSRETVKKTLSGDRNNKAVIQAAEVLLQTREQATQTFKQSIL